MYSGKIVNTVDSVEMTVPGRSGLKNMEINIFVFRWKGTNVKWRVNHD